MNSTVATNQFLLTRKQVCNLLNISRSSLRRIVRADESFPIPVNLGIKKEQWIRDEILAWATSGRLPVPSASNDLPASTEPEIVVSECCTCDDLPRFLSEEDVDEIFPVHVIPDVSGDLKAVTLNWVEHCKAYFCVVVWFGQLAKSYPYEMIEDLYLNFTAEQKAILQRGLDMFHGDWPPLLHGERYVIELEMDDEVRSSFDFPVRRIKSDAGADANGFVSMHSTEYDQGR